MTTVRAVELRTVGIPLIRPFRTSFGEETHKSCVLVRVVTDDAEGWGECVAGPDPGYSEEFNDGAWLVLGGFLVPALFAAGDVTTDDLDRVLAGVRGQPDGEGHADRRVPGRRAARRGAIAWPSTSGPTSDRVACGVSVGITPTTDQLLEQVDGYLAEGYRRIKLKIEPGLDVERVERGPRRAPRHPALGRRQRRLHAGRRRRLPGARRARPADGRTTAAPRRPGRARGAAGPDPHRHLSGRVDPLGGATRPPRSSWAPAGSSTSSRAASGVCPRRGASTTWLGPRASPCGAAACSRPGSAGRRTWRSPRSRGSRFRATPAHPRATSPTTSRSRSCWRADGTMAVPAWPGDRRHAAT